MSYLILRKENLKLNFNINKYLKFFYSIPLFNYVKGIGEINSNVDMIFIKNMTDEFQQVCMVL